MPKKTLWRWLEKLEKARRIASVSDMKKTPILDSAGVPHETSPSCKQEMLIVSEPVVHGKRRLWLSWAIADASQARQNLDDEKGICKVYTLGGSQAMMLISESCRLSAKQIEEWSEMSKMTLWRWLEKLEKLGE